MTHTAKKWTALALLGLALCILIATILITTARTSDHSKTPDKATGSTPASSQDTGNPVTTDTTKQDTGTSPQTAPDGYLLIKEWDIAFKLPAEMQGGVGYAIKELDNTNQIAYFEIEKITNLPGSACGLSANGNGIGVYIRRSSSKASRQETAYHLFANKELGNHFYAGGREKYADSCMTDQAYTQQTIDAIGALTQSLTGLEVAPRQ